MADYAVSVYILCEFCAYAVQRVCAVTMQAGVTEGD